MWNAIKALFGGKRKRPEGNLVAHARRELKAAGLFDEDSDYGGMLGDSALELVGVFSEQGHSGASASMMSNLFNKLSRFEPLSPLTGEDDEWDEVGHGTLQNRRCSHVFKENGEAYDIQGKIFREPNGVCYTSSESHVPVTFPYNPKSETVDVAAAG